MERLGGPEAAWAALAWQVRLTGDGLVIHEAFEPERTRGDSASTLISTEGPTVLFHSSVSDRLQRAIDSSPADEHSVTFSFDDRDRGVLGLPWATQVAILAGAHSRALVEEARVAAFDSWRANNTPDLEAASDHLELCGATVHDVLWLSNQIVASASRECIETLTTASTRAFQADLTEPARQDGEGYTMAIQGLGINGVELEDMIQSTQFYDDGIDGFDAGWAVFVEGGRAWNGHWGFDDGTMQSRIHVCLSASTSGFCSVPLGSYTTVQHKTAVASILLGDITAGQDPNVTGTVARRQRSGVARGARGVGVANYNGSLLDNVLANSTYAPKVLTRSESSGVPNCSAGSSANQRLNSIFEAGVASFQSHGNNPPSGAACTVSAPGAAIAAFTVGSYDTNSSDNPTIRSNSSTGPAPDGRTLIDMVLPQRYENAYPHYAWPQDSNGNTYHYGAEWDPMNPGPEWFGSSSAATPAMAGSAMLVRHWFLDTYGSAIDDPGLLYANLLLMGDRQSANGDPGTRMISNFHPRWGAGKLRLRQFDSTGMEAPYGYSSGSVCVGRDETVRIAMTTTNSNVDVMRAVTWWHDRGHDNGNGFGGVDLALQRELSCSPFYCSYATPEGSSTASDNKQRVHLDGPTAGKWVLRLDGQSDITTDAEGCGNNAVRVYYAWFAEGSDRPAGVLPTVRPE
ncbi:MAG: hypothetical protein R3F61_34280 [Myxococcota bacterium]